MEWDGPTIDRLSALWAEGHSAQKIADRMGISKNAVVGKAHRLDLPARPSPIKRDGYTPPAAKPKRVTGPTLPALSAAPPPVVIAAPASSAPAPKPVQIVPPPAAAKPVGFFKTCQFPMENLSTGPVSNWRFCDAPIGRKADGSASPYCSEHHARCHEKHRINLAERARDEARSRAAWSIAA